MGSFMRCPICQTESPPNARVCTRCGGALAESAAGSAIAGTGGFAGPISSGPPTQHLPSASAFGDMPERFDSYEILRKPDGTLWELGRGAMGITYKAIDADLQVPVALKVINPSVLGNPDAAERFLREARSAARLRHGNIASVFRLGRVGETHFYAMEFCEGQTVHQLVERRGPLELKLALEITRQVTQALVVAQDHGVVHRDIKPSNLMITGRVPEEFTVKVIDFGLAKHTGADSAAADITLASDRRGFVGTAHFASPEQLEDRPVDFRSDIYSLGVTLWFMLTGKPLFGGSLTRVVTQHLVQPPPMEKVAWLPPRVAGVIESMLAKDPDARPASMRALRDQLSLAIEESSTDVTMAATPDLMPISPPTRPPSPPSSVAPKATTPPSPHHPTVPPMPPASSVPPSIAPPPSSVPPQSAPPSYASAPAASPPPMVMPPTIPPRPAAAPAQVPFDAPARPKPTSSGPIIVACIGLVFLIVAALGAGYAFNRWGRKLIAKPGSTTGPAEVIPDKPSTPPPLATPGPSSQSNVDALRELRVAEEATEVLSKKLFNVSGPNKELIKNLQERISVISSDSPSYDEALKSLDRYKQMDRDDENAIIDAEQRYLICAKRLAKMPPDVVREAFDTLDKEIASAGIGWRIRLVELLRRYLPKVAPDDTRVDPDFRSQLRELQKD